MIRNGELYSWPESDKRVIEREMELRVIKKEEL